MFIPTDCAVAVGQESCAFAFGSTKTIRRIVRRKFLIFIMGFYEDTYLSRVVSLKKNNREVVGKELIPPPQLAGYKLF
jgi:hypothetical protein